ncbi:MAG: VWA domain-containing protein [Actinomyces sp.]|nr:MAG: VWA domain-containing protein [Actinomyces sp.]
MTFTDPVRLWLLVAVGAVLVAYLVVARRRPRYALRVSDTSLYDTVAPRRPGWRRHLVAAGFVAALASMVLAVAGPAATEEVPRERATVVLTIDTSLSMGATDVDPSRIEAAKAAALAFLDDAPPSVQVGLVSFDGTPVVRVTPTDDRRAVADAIESLRLGEGTATGEAIIASLDALRTVGAVAEPSADGTAPDGPADGTAPGDDKPPAVIVLLSDGTPTMGRPVDVAVAAARQAGVPVSTVAFGTPDGTVVIPDPDIPGREVTVPVPIDEPTLEHIADETGGEFFTASSSEELAAVYDDIGTTIGVETVLRDRTDWFVGAALVAALLTAVGSLAWFERLP